MNTIQSPSIKIEEFLISIIETHEYKSIEYLVFSIRKNYLEYLSDSRVNQFQIPYYLRPLVTRVIDKFNALGINTSEMLDYMLKNDINGWIHYYTYAVLIDANTKEIPELTKRKEELFALVLTGYIIESCRDYKIDIQKMIDSERFLYQTNQYGLSIVEDVIFKRDYFVYDGKAYLYNILTNTNVINFTDDMPGFAKIITEKVNTGNILLRLDERLALPMDYAISYSTLNFEKFYGPQFHFKDSIFTKKKTIIVHIDKNSLDKLLMVIKKDFDQNCNEYFWHIEIETLPNMNEKTNRTHCITTFLHGMYYPSSDRFTHIDCTKNQYAMNDYLKKYTESEDNISIDLYTKKDLHYKIWCIENGKYSREVWYELMIVSLSKKYQTLLDEMLE